MDQVNGRNQIQPLHMVDLIITYDWLKMSPLEAAENLSVGLLVQAHVLPASLDASDRRLIRFTGPLDALSELTQRYDQSLYNPVFVARQVERQMKMFVGAWTDLHLPDAQ